MKYLINSMNIKEILVGIKEYISTKLSQVKAYEQVNLDTLDNFIIESQYSGWYYKEIPSQLLNNIWDNGKIPVLQMVLKANNVVVQDIVCSIPIYKYNVNIFSGYSKKIGPYEINIETTGNLIGVHINIINMEVTTNKVTSISASSTNTQYPSAKCVFDYANQKPTFATLSPTALTHELEATLQCGYDYFVDGTVDTCEFILPESPDEREISVIFTTDTNPAITITANNSDHIYVNGGFGFEANSTYEMNIRSSGGTYDYYIVLVKMEELV